MTHVMAEAPPVPHRRAIARRLRGLTRITPPAGWQSAEARRGRVTLAAVAALTAVLLLAACGSRPVPRATARSEKPVRGGTLVVAGPNDLQGMNSLVAGEAYTAEVLEYVLFLPLVQYGPKLDYEPRLAESWRMDGDSAVVFHLRHDVFWHDGVRATAADVVFTYRRAVDPATEFANAQYFSDWKGVEALDSFTVRFRFRPQPDPLAGLPFLPIMPAHLLDTVPPERMRTAAFNHHPVGDGPFRFVEYRANDHWTFEANPSFPKALGGPPYLDRVVYRVIPDNAAEAAELISGGADLILAPRASQLHQLASRPGIRAIVRPSRNYVFIGWNERRRPFGDARVRRALALALDRAQMLQLLRAGYGELAVGPVASFHWAYDRDLAPLPYAPDSARALLAEAGYLDRDGDGVVEDPAGRPFVFELTVAAKNDFNRDLAELVRQQLARVGVVVKARPLDFSAMIDRISSPERDFDAVFTGWQSDFRLSLREQFDSREMKGPFQIASYANPVVDSLLDRVERARTREEARPAWVRLQTILRDDQPWTYLWYAPELYAMRTRVRGAKMDIRGAFVNLPQWWLDPAGDAAGDVAAGGR